MRGAWWLHGGGAGANRRRAFPAEAALLAAILLAGCAAEAPVPNAGPSEAPPGVGPGEVPQAVCLQGTTFVADGDASPAGTGAGDAVTVSGLRWESYPGCERFVVDLAAEGGSPAAAPGEVRARVLRDLGVVRVMLPGVARAEADATDARIDGPLGHAAYVVSRLDGEGVYVDLHLGDAAEVHVMELRDPARVVVDLRPGGGPIPPPAVTNVRVVVIQPRSGPASYPLTVTGYSRTFEANVVARLERNGQEVLETFTTAAGWLDAWGEFSLPIEAGPSGPVRLHVGEYSARDGTWEGVALDLEMR
jgi:hypothetical protein